MDLHFEKAAREKGSNLLFTEKKMLETCNLNVSSIMRTLLNYHLNYMLMNNILERKTY